MRSRESYALLAQVHQRLAYSRRVRALAQHLSRLLPPDASVLDVGCGDGLIDSLILAQRDDLCLAGVDTRVRSESKIPVRQFDGESLPFADSEFDVAILIDVLHHTEAPFRLLKEVRRVARDSILIKDHILSGPVSSLKLRFMDWLGNARFGVSLPYNYWTRAQWREAFSKLGLEVTVCERDLGLYAYPLDLVFGRGLHFISKLEHRSD